MFGSVTYAHVPDQQRTKLEEKSKRYIFIGYHEKIKGYKLLDPISKTVMVSHDVRVNEASEWDWNNSTEVYQQTQKFFMMKMNHDNPKCKVCETYMIQQMRYTLYVF